MFSKYIKGGVVPKSFNKSRDFDKGFLDSNEGYTQKTALWICH